VLSTVGQLAAIARTGSKASDLFGRCLPILDPVAAQVRRVGVRSI
jgi:hypothetical protein